MDQHHLLLQLYIHDFVAYNALFAKTTQLHAPYRYQKRALLEAATRRPPLNPPRMLPLEDLPGPAHAIIASMIPDGYDPDSRLRMSEVSRSMLTFYGGTLNNMYVRRRDQYPQAELASFLGRQRGLDQNSTCRGPPQTCP